jgi:hypothetical protein
LDQEHAGNPFQDVRLDSAMSLFQSAMLCD